MTRSARVYDFTIPAGGAVTVLAEGSFYRLMTAAGSIEVRRNNGSIVGPLLPGQGERAEFLSLTLTDKSGASNPGSILIGDDTFIDDRISGEVSVIDGEVARSLAAVAFIGSNYMNPGAGLSAHVQLWNPVGSGKRLVVGSSVFSGSSEFSLLRLKRHNAPLANLAASPQNLMETGPATVAQLRNEANAGVLGGVSLTGPLWAAGNSFNRREFVTPILIDPGSGIHWVQGTVNLLLAAEFEYFEVPA